MRGAHVVFHFLTQLIAVHLWHHHVTDNDIGGILYNFIPCLFSIGGFKQRELFFQRIFHKIPEVVVIVYHQDTCPLTFPRLLVLPAVFFIHKSGLLVLFRHTGLRSDILKPVHRKLKKKQASLGHVIVYLYGSFTDGDELFHDMQPDPAPGEIVVSYLPLVKALEYPFFLVIFYTYAGIYYSYLQ